MPLLSKSYCQLVQEQTDLVAIIQEFVPLKRAGATLKGSSPFIKERTPSFMVSPVKNVWKCFASGHGGNSAISFLMEAQGMTYPEAIVYCGNKLGKTPEYDENEVDQKEWQAAQEKKTALRNLLKAALLQYNKAYTALPAAAPARKEVTRREYDQTTLGEYGIGYAPGKKFIYDHVVANGLKEQALSIGLIGLKGYDTFWDRLIYPIYDEKGELAGLAGRDLSGKETSAKWINSKGSTLYDKDRIWYGMHIARAQIRLKNTAWIVEGYNDVIAWHNNGYLNTIAPCGTAITDTQIALLRKKCSRVVFAMDGDRAGRAAVIKYAPAFIKAGFRVEVCTLDDGTTSYDPDDFCRAHKAQIEKEGLDTLIDSSFKPVDAMRLLEKEHLQGDDASKLSGAKKLATIIATIEDEYLRNMYTEGMAKQSPLKPTDAKKLVDSFRQSLKPVENNDAEGMYTMPKGIELTKELRKCIEKYGLFQGKNQIWIQRGDEPPFTFRGVSNFQIEIIQHMKDEKYPMKLVRIQNVHTQKEVFDIISSDINKPQSFEAAVTNQGNFFWNGTAQDLNKLKRMLFEEMGTGRKIDVLGWQPEGFWCFNNRIIVPGKASFEVDANGLFTHDNVSYYIPSANSIYKLNPYKFEPQKKFRVEQAKKPIGVYLAKMREVHRDHAITAMLFTMASVFQDIVVKNVESFPILFFYGPASTGKDKLAECCQAFLGRPQTAINLEGGNSTATAQIREFAQFTNGVSHLSEYKRGDAKLDGTLKGIWDRRGKKMGNIESRIATDSVPILSSAIMTGNDFPDNEALITRCIWNEIIKTTFTEKEESNFNELVDWTGHGISSYTEDLLRFRESVDTQFMDKYRAFKTALQSQVPDAVSRMIGNMAVLGAMYEVFKDKVQFPFTFNEMSAHFKKTLEMQVRKLNSSSVLNKWWDCFLASMRGTLSDQIRVGRDIKVEGKMLYFQHTNCYNKIQRQWAMQYKGELAPGKSTMKDVLKKSSPEYKEVKNMRLGTSTNPTSVIGVNGEDISVWNEILDAVWWQESESGAWNNSPATLIEKETSRKDSIKSGDELPF